MDPGQMSTCKSSKDLVVVVVLEGKGALCCLAYGQILHIEVGALQGRP